MANATPLEMISVIMVTFIAAPSWLRAPALGPPGGAAMTMMTRSGRRCMVDDGHSRGEVAGLIRPIPGSRTAGTPPRPRSSSRGPASTTAGETEAGGESVGQDERCCVTRNPPASPEKAPAAVSPNMAVRSTGTPRRADAVPTADCRSRSPARCAQRDSTAAMRTSASRIAMVAGLLCRPSSAGAPTRRAVRMRECLRGRHG